MAAFSFILSRLQLSSVIMVPSSFPGKDFKSFFQFLYNVFERRQDTNDVIWSFAHFKQSIIHLSFLYISSLSTKSVPLKEPFQNPWALYVRIVLRNLCGAEKQDLYLNIYCPRSCYRARKVIILIDKKRWMWSEMAVGQRLNPIN